MKLVTIKNVSKDFNYQFVTNLPVTDELVCGYLQKCDDTLKIELSPWGIFSNYLEDYVEYSVNFITEITK